MDTTFIEGAFCTCDATCWSLVNLAWCAVVSNEDDVRFCQVYGLKQAANFVIKCFEHSDVIVQICVSIGGVASGNGDVGLWIMKRAVWRIKSHPDNPRRGILSGDEGHGIIYLHTSGVGRAVGARDEGSDVCARVSDGSVFNFHPNPISVVRHTTLNGTGEVWPATCICRA